MTLSYLEGRRCAANTPWTAERVELLTVMWGQGYSASQIAKEIRDIHISRSAIIGKAHRLGLPGREPRKRDIRPAAQREPRVRIWKPKPEPKPKPQPIANGEPAMRMLTLFQLKPTSCRWPIGDGPFLFCGADANGSYCPHHQRIARTPKRP